MKKYIIILCFCCLFLSGVNCYKSKKKITSAKKSVSVYEHQKKFFFARKSMGDTIIDTVSGNTTSEYSNLLVYKRLKLIIKSKYYTNLENPNFLYENFFEQKIFFYNNDTLTGIYKNIKTETTIGNRSYKILNNPISSVSVINTKNGLLVKIIRGSLFQKAEYYTIFDISGNIIWYSKTIYTPDFLFYEHCNLDSIFEEYEINIDNFNHPEIEIII